MSFSRFGQVSERWVRLRGGERVQVRVVVHRGPHPRTVRAKRKTEPKARYQPMNTHLAGTIALSLLGARVIR